MDGISTSPIGTVLYKRRGVAPFDSSTFTLTADSLDPTFISLILSGASTKSDFALVNVGSIALPNWQVSFPANSAGAISSLEYFTSGSDNDAADDVFEGMNDINDDDVIDSSQRHVVAFQSSTKIEGCSASPGIGYFRDNCGR